MSITHQSRRAGLGLGLVGLLLSGTLLSGCGVSGSTLVPGAAASVDSTAISTSEVDSTVTDYCGYFAGKSQAPVARGTIKSTLLQVLVRREIARQMLDEAGLDIADTDYNATMSDFDTNQLPQLDNPTAAQTAAVRLGVEAGTYADRAFTLIGRQLLEDEGQTAPVDQVSAVRGQRALAEWLGSHDVELNPLYGLAVRDGDVALDPDSQLAVASSDVAQLASIAPVDQPGSADEQAQQEKRLIYIGNLPADQVCG